MACHRARLRHPRWRRRAVPAIEQHRLRRAARYHRASEGVLHADVRASRSRVRRLRLHAAGAGRLVPERGEAVGIGPMPALIDTIEGTRIAAHRPWPRVVVNEDGWRFATNQLAAGHWTL